MKFHRMLALASALAMLGLPAPYPAQAVEPSTAIAPKEGWYHQLRNASFVAGYAILPKPDGVMIIDSRPTARKYDLGHIPTAINIPDSQFEKLLDKLPADKDTLLIFYCDGPECLLSHNSAFKAEKLGYTRVHVYAAGYPDWLKQGHIGAVSVPYIKKLQDEGAPMT
jgi:rhodanese-related sulfurtransferase